MDRRVWEEIRRRYLTATLGGRGQPIIVLSSTTVGENAIVGTVIGILSVAGGSGSYTFTITSDPDNKFVIADVDELETDATLDYETATSHQVTIQADNGVDAPISKTFTINVTDQAESDAILLESGDRLLLDAGTQVNKDTSIPAATDASTLTGDEYVAIVQSGTTYRVKTRVLAEYIDG